MSSKPIVLARSLKLSSLIAAGSIVWFIFLTSQLKRLSYICLARASRLSMALPLPKAVSIKSDPIFVTSFKRMNANSFSSFTPNREAMFAEMYSFFILPAFEGKIGSSKEAGSNSSYPNSKIAAHIFQIAIIYSSVNLRVLMVVSTSLNSAFGSSCLIPPAFR